MILLFALLFFGGASSSFAMDWADQSILTKNNSPIKEKFKTEGLHAFTLYLDAHDVVHIKDANERVVVKVFSHKRYCDYVSINRQDRTIDFIRLKITTNAQIEPEIDLYENSECLFSQVFRFPSEYNYLCLRRRHSKLVVLLIHNSRLAPQQ